MRRNYKLRAMPQLVRTSCVPFHGNKRSELSSDTASPEPPRGLDILRLTNHSTHGGAAHTVREKRTTMDLPLTRTRQRGDILPRESVHAEDLARKQDETHHELHDGEPEDARHEQVARFVVHTTDPQRIHHAGCSGVRDALNVMFQARAVIIDLLGLAAIRIPRRACHTDFCLVRIEFQDKSLHVACRVLNRHVQDARCVSHEVVPGQIVSRRIVASIVVCQTDRILGGVGTEVRDDDREEELDAGDHRNHEDGEKTPG
mmetsp:Transcript_56044/g.149521  ORF Transcript_56044/g.149521 Transcript_56044/m.149521 type:complete len:259 (-) Transcript_56044:209-985(-)